MLYNAFKQAGVIDCEQLDRLVLLGGEGADLAEAVLCFVARCIWTERLDISEKRLIGTSCLKCTVGPIKSICSRMCSGTEYVWQPSIVEWSQIIICDGRNNRK